MRADQVLRKCLGQALESMHALRRQVLLRSVQALLQGRRLTLMDLARSWPNAERVRTPLKALDRLLSNGLLHAQREQLYAAMGRWLLRTDRPVIVVDWSTLKADGSWHLLRAATPVGGRALVLLEMVVGADDLASPAVERRFLQRLAAIVPPGVRPIMITDAGFRMPWFRAVSQLQWHWIGRLCSSPLVKPVTAPDTDDQWTPCRALHGLATARARDLGLMQVTRSNTTVSRVVVYRRTAKGRKHLTRAGATSCSSSSRKNAARERQPWLLAVSPQLHDLSATQIVKLYAKRMQIEQSFRDLKSHRYGSAFEDSLTRKGRRIEILLLIHAMTTFVSWLAGLACRATHLDQRLQPNSAKRPACSTVRMGREALVRNWIVESLERVLHRLRHPDPRLLAELQLP